jgi:hypothetical protein
MNKIRNIILVTAIVLLSSMALAAEPANKPDEQKDPIIGHSAQQDYLDEIRERQTEKSTMWYKVFGAVACVGILSVGGLMIYLRFKSNEQ